MLVKFFHDLALSLFPIGTNEYLMHAIVIGILSIFVYLYFKSNKLTFIHILILTIFIEIDQFIFKSGSCDILDIIAGLDGCLLILYLLNKIKTIIK